MKAFVYVVTVCVKYRHRRDPDGHPNRLSRMFKVIATSQYAAADAGKALMWRLFELASSEGNELIEVEQDSRNVVATLLFEVDGISEEVVK